MEKENKFPDGEKGKKLEEKDDDSKSLPQKQVDRDSLQSEEQVNDDIRMKPQPYNKD